MYNPKGEMKLSEYVKVGELLERFKERIFFSISFEEIEDFHVHDEELFASGFKFKTCQIKKSILHINHS